MPSRAQCRGCIQTLAGRYSRSSPITPSGLGLASESGCTTVSDSVSSDDPPIAPCSIPSSSRAPVSTEYGDPLLQYRQTLVVLYSCRCESRERSAQKKARLNLQVEDMMARLVGWFSWTLERRRGIAALANRGPFD